MTTTIHTSTDYRHTYLLELSLAGPTPSTLTQALQYGFASKFHMLSRKTVNSPMDLLCACVVYIAILSADFTSSIYGNMFTGV